MKKETIELSLYMVIVVMAVIGTALCSIYIHEYMHMADYKNEDVNVYDETLCVLSVPTNITWNSVLNGAAGYYSFNFDEKDRDKINKISKYTEIKAYFVTLTIFLIMGLILHKYTKIRYDK